MAANGKVPDCEPLDAGRRPTDVPNSLGRHHANIFECDVVNPSDGIGPVLVEEIDHECTSVIVWIHPRGVPDGADLDAPKSHIFDHTGRYFELDCPRQRGRCHLAERHVLERHIGNTARGRRT